MFNKPCLNLTIFHFRQNLPYDFTVGRDCDLLIRALLWKRSPKIAFLSSFRKLDDFYGCKAYDKTRDLSFYTINSQRIRAEVKDRYYIKMSAIAGLTICLVTSKPAVVLSRMDTSAGDV